MEGGGGKLKSQHQVEDLSSGNKADKAELKHGTP